MADEGDLETKKPGRRDVGMLKGTGLGLSEALEPLLRNRLRVVALMLASGFALAAVRGFLVEEEVWGWPFVATLLGLLGVAVLLSSEKDLSESGLRKIEFAMFGLLTIVLTMTSVRGTLEAAEAAIAHRVLVYPSRSTLSFFALIVIYGLLIPNHWKRTAFVVAPMALISVLTPIVLKAWRPVIQDVAPAYASFEMISGSSVFILVGAIVAIYGAYSIQTLRKEAFEAKKIGQYELQKKVGEGGMGEVWLARHALLARPAAIKLIGVDQLGAGGEDAVIAVKRFIQEAKMTAQLRSPHTIEIFDFGTTDDGSFYYVMEMLEGLDLEKLVEEHGPLPPARVVKLLMQMCDSLGEAHEQGMVHRDVKPQNIFCCRMGLNLDYIKVLDFGLVMQKETPDDLRMTQRGVMGTPTYIAPEMAVGRKDIDGRADIYALGCVAYWLLTGGLVFESKTVMEQVVDHAKTQPRRPSARVDHVIGTDLDDIVMACLEKDPANRPQTATELSDRLEACEFETEWSRSLLERWWRLHVSK